MKNLNKEPVVFRLTEKSPMTSVPLSLRRRAVCCKHEPKHISSYTVKRDQDLISLVNIVKIECAKEAQSGFKTKMEHYNPNCSEISENPL